jgi:PKD repeat protein
MPSAPLPPHVVRSLAVSVLVGLACSACMDVEPPTSIQSSLHPVLRADVGIAATCATLPAGLTAWWRGEANTDEYVAARSGTWVGSASYGAGQVGQAFHFDGSNYVTVPDDPAWAFGTQPFTIETWVKASSSPGGWGGDALDLLNQAGAWELFGHRVFDGTQQLIFGLFPNHGIAVKFPGLTEQWYHFAVTRSDTVYTLYVDGAKVGSDSDTFLNSLPDVAEPLKIGYGFFANYSSYVTTGYIDEASIYNRALSASEIAAIAGAGSAGKCIPPVATGNGPYSGTEGTAVAFSSAGSVDPDGGALTYAWTFGNGKTSTLANPSNIYTDNGVYNVRLIVTDPTGAKDTASTTATIANVAPTATFTAPASIVEGAGYTLKLAGADKGAVDKPTLEYALDCGLGAGYTTWSKTIKQVTCPVQPDQRTAITVRGKVRDKDGGEKEYTKLVKVTNAKPVVTLSATTPTTFSINGSLSISGSFTDKGANDATWTYSIAWGDGTAATTGTASAQGGAITASHPYTKTGTFKVQMNVTDKDGAIGKSPIITVTVNP